MSQPFYQTIGYHFSFWDVNQVNFSYCNLISDVIILNVNMLYSSIKEQIVCQKNWALIITFHWDQIYWFVNNNRFKKNISSLTFWACEKLFFLFSNFSVMLKSLNATISFIDIDFYILVFYFEKSIKKIYLNPIHLTDPGSIWSILIYSWSTSKYPNWLYF